MNLWGHVWSGSSQLSHQTSSWWFLPGIDQLQQQDLLHLPPWSSWKLLLCSCKLDESRSAVRQIAELTMATMSLYVAWSPVIMYLSPSPRDVLTSRIIYSFFPDGIRGGSEPMMLACLCGWRSAHTCKAEKPGSPASASAGASSSCEVVIILPSSTQAKRPQPGHLNKSTDSLVSQYVEVT